MSLMQYIPDVSKGYFKGLCERKEENGQSDMEMLDIGYIV